MHDFEGAIELHRLVVEDFTQLERRAEEIDEAVIDATCTVEDIGEEVRHAPHPFLSTGHAPISCLYFQSLELCAPASEQGRRSQQSCKIVR